MIFFCTHEFQEISTLKLFFSRMWLHFIDSYSSTIDFQKQIDLSGGR